jgi:predicted nucleic acid-binding Zn ribbon protein
MSDSRIKKYEQYRKNIAKRNDDEVFDEDKKPTSRVIHHTNTLNTTSALPIDEIVQTLNERSEEEIQLQKQRRRAFMKQALLIGGLILAAILIIVVGIISFI